MFNNLQGQPVPASQFLIQNDGNWQKRDTSDIFDNRTVIVFALPGAYTPTCSSTHVPRYNELAKTFSDLGVDEIVCVSVNDPFVMDAWQKHQNAPNITFIGDGNGDFTDAMNMLTDKSDLAFGKRSWRYSMLVRNGVIDKMFIEPDQPGDPFEVSDAYTMLKYLAPESELPADILVVSRPGCSHCARAKTRLDDTGLRYQEIQLNREISGSGLRALSGAETVPQIFINGVCIGGADDLEQWLDIDCAA